MHCQRKAVEAGKIGAADKCPRPLPGADHVCGNCIATTLLSLMPRAVDLSWKRGSGPVQCARPGKPFPCRFYISPRPLDDVEAARAFLRDHGKAVACYRLDPREEGTLMVGIMFNDGESKIIAREELNIEVSGSQCAESDDEGTWRPRTPPTANHHRDCPEGRIT
jgi:hypothetical protein